MKREESPLHPWGVLKASSSPPSIPTLSAGMKAYRLSDDNTYTSTMTLRRKYDNTRVNYISYDSRINANARIRRGVGRFLKTC